jgi:hypothetical protein
MGSQCFSDYSGALSRLCLAWVNESKERCIFNEIRLRRSLFLKFTLPDGGGDL